jgi:hypothetical protein
MQQTNPRNRYFQTVNATVPIARATKFDRESAISARKTKDVMIPASSARRRPGIAFAPHQSNAEGCKHQCANGIRLPEESAELDHAS